MKITRRTAIKGLGALAGVAAAPGILGCDSDGGGGGDGGPGDGGGGGFIKNDKGITTIIVMCMENRSYDHFLGARKLLESLPGDGLVAGTALLDQSGKSVEIFKADVACVADPPHGWNPSHAQWNEGKNDGFVTAYQASQGASIPPHVMGYMTRADLPASWALADAYTSCDRWFCSLLGPTWPNRCYLLSGQSGGLKTNQLPPGGRFPWDTIFHRLNDKKVPWASYFTDVPFVSLWGTKVDPGGSVRRIDDFFVDAEAGALPPVVFIDPGFTSNDDHPPHHPVLGQQLIASLHASLAASPQWSNILWVITYDENGGFYDHVPPPTAPDALAAEGFGQLGFRVPTLLVGPYVKAGHVSSTVYDHTSVLRHIEKMHDLEPLGQRDAAANDLGDAIDMDRLARKDPAAPAKLPEIVVDPAVITPFCKSGGGGGVGGGIDIEDLAARGYFPPEQDLRWRRDETLRLIAAQLERFGGGGMRRGK